ncbi:glycosyltransferase family 2 protein [Mesobacterium sp. TK19101]|uniref:Glycosyltransferase family 2 protein n=1 Tax=Mesobacterium hydrothermale TaxID=3111907 RepID=A0ABU6HDS6_9RHOB|nr:glycosyltransferase family 2 protein [Mesobacterium sp. TK19101]MEC3860536.1 glycosyltransferase family 2 protein [Mesobacterium sp. TK19101]
MKIILHIGPDAVHSDRLQQVLEDKRAQLIEKGVLFARSPGGRNHTRLYMGVSDPDAPDSLRAGRGFASPEAQEALRQDIETSLEAEVMKYRPALLILSAHQLGANLCHRSEIARLHALLAPISPDITILAHVEDPARMALRAYAAQIMDGRVRGLGLELGLLDRPDWWQACVGTRPKPALQFGIFPEAQMALHWLDFAALVREWDAVFGKGATQLRALDIARLSGPDATAEILAAFGLDTQIGSAVPTNVLPDPSAAWLSRARRFNDALIRLMRVEDQTIPRSLWRRLLGELRIDGPASDPGALSALSDRFAPSHAALLSAHPGLTTAALAPCARKPGWIEADAGQGFRATQYLMAFGPRLKQAFKDEAAKARTETAAPTPETIDDVLSPDARRLMPPLAKQKFLSLHGSAFRPHNNLGLPDETTLFPAFSPPAPRTLREGNTGNLIVGCMKNEAPYIVEWVAYHRVIGFDSFMIYTNGCEDPTDPILKRLEAMGIVHHRDNENWTGKSPQQFALDQAMEDPVLKAADWIAHIDVDEFVNIRCGNGTLQDFMARVPDATNIAMTWRLFGHGGVRRFDDTPVIAQFTDCAPRYCPKPHTVWGFKTMTRNIGAYEKLSCHRPNRLRPALEHQVRWVNGNGQDMTREAAKSGWRSSKRSIGYDLLQLNHYALRSAESFLIKRQRGRALHVDRSIGLNYWIRMDWSGARDTTIQRNLPRVQAEIAHLLADPELKRLHDAGVAWHRAKAAELHATEEFEDLYQQAIALRLTPEERAAWALALDMES